MNILRCLLKCNIKNSKKKTHRMDIIKNLMLEAA